MIVEEVSAEVLQLDYGSPRSAGTRNQAAVRRLLSGAVMLLLASCIGRFVSGNLLTQKAWNDACQASALVFVLRFGEGRGTATTPTEVLLSTSLGATVGALSAFLRFGTLMLCLVAVSMFLIHYPCPSKGRPGIDVAGTACPSLGFWQLLLAAFWFVSRSAAGSTLHGCLSAALCHVALLVIGWELLSTLSVPGSGSGDAGLYDRVASARSAEGGEPNGRRSPTHLRGGVPYGRRTGALTRSASSGTALGRSAGFGSSTFVDADGDRTVFQLQATGAPLFSSVTSCPAPLGGGAAWARPAPRSASSSAAAAAAAAFRSHPVGPLGGRSSGLTASLHGPLGSSDDGAVATRGSGPHQGLQLQGSGAALGPGAGACADVVASQANEDPGVTGALHGPFGGRSGVVAAAAVCGMTGGTDAYGDVLQDGGLQQQQRQRPEEDTVWEPLGTVGCGPYNKSFGQCTTGTAPPARYAGLSAQLQRRLTEDSSAHDYILLASTLPGGAGYGDEYDDDDDEEEEYDSEAYRNGDDSDGCFSLVIDGGGGGGGAGGVAPVIGESGLRQRDGDEEGERKAEATPDGPLPADGAAAAAAEELVTLPADAPTASARGTAGPRRNANATPAVVAGGCVMPSARPGPRDDCGGGGGRSSPAYCNGYGRAAAAVQGLYLPYDGVVVAAAAPPLDIYRCDIADLEDLMSLEEVEAVAGAAAGAPGPDGQQEPQQAGRSLVEASTEPQQGAPPHSGTASRGPRGLVGSAVAPPSPPRGVDVDRGADVYAAEGQSGAPPTVPRAERLAVRDGGAEGVDGREEGQEGGSGGGRRSRRRSVEAVAGGCDGVNGDGGRLMDAYDGCGVPLQEETLALHTAASLAYQSQQQQFLLHAGGPSADLAAAAAAAGNDAATAGGGGGAGLLRMAPSSTSLELLDCFLRDAAELARSGCGANGEEGPDGLHIAMYSSQDVHCAGSERTEYDRAGSALPYRSVGRSGLGHSEPDRRGLEQRRHEDGQKADPSPHPHHPHLVSQKVEKGAKRPKQRVTDCRLHVRKLSAGQLLARAVYAAADQSFHAQHAQRVVQQQHAEGQQQQQHHHPAATADLNAVRSGGSGAGPVAPAHAHLGCSDLPKAYFNPCFQQQQQQQQLLYDRCPPDQGRHDPHHNTAEALRPLSVAASAAAAAASAAPDGSDGALLSPAAVAAAAAAAAAAAVAAAATGVEDVQALAQTRAELHARRCSVDAASDARPAAVVAEAHPRQHQLQLQPGLRRSLDSPRRTAVAAEVYGGGGHDEHGRLYGSHSHHYQQAAPPPSSPGGQGAALMALPLGAGTPFVLATSEVLWEEEETFGLEDCGGGSPPGVRQVQPQSGPAGPGGLGCPVLEASNIAGSGSGDGPAPAGSNHMITAATVGTPMASIVQPFTGVDQMPYKSLSFLHRQSYDTHHLRAGCVADGSHSQGKYGTARGVLPLRPADSPAAPATTGSSPQPPPPPQPIPSARGHSSADLGTSASAPPPRALAGGPPELVGETAAAASLGSHRARPGRGAAELLLPLSANPSAPGPAAAGPGACAAAAECCDAAVEPMDVAGAEGEAEVVGSLTSTSRVTRLTLPSECWGGGHLACGGGGGGGGGLVIASPQTHRSWTLNSNVSETDRGEQEDGDGEEGH